jgi:recombinational DNA repair ATPase RecF
LSSFEDPKKILRIVWFTCKELYKLVEKETTEDLELTNLKDKQIKFMTKVKNIRKTMREINTTLNTTRNLLQVVDDQLKEIPEVQQAVRDEAVYAIKDGIEKHKATITLFEIANSDYYVELSKDKWKSTLENIIQYYAEKEDYDKCVEARDLISKL